MIADWDRFFGLDSEHIAVIFNQDYSEWRVVDPDYESQLFDPAWTANGGRMVKLSRRWHGFKRGAMTPCECDRAVKLARSLLRLPV